MANFGSVKLAAFDTSVDRGRYFQPPNHRRLRTPVAPLEGTLAGSNARSVRSNDASAEKTFV